MLKDFKLRPYLVFALKAEILFVLILLGMAYYTVNVIKDSALLMEFMDQLFAGLAQKVGHTTLAGMTVKIFVNNFLITIAPLAIFLISLLPVRGLKVLAVFFSAAVGVFLYFINALVAGIALGAMSITTGVSYGSLIAVTMVHGSLELFAMAAGTMFSVYYLYKISKRPPNNNESRIHIYLPAARQLIFKLILILALILAAAAIIETYISMALAERLLA
ncbi:stage II sporulation protein M [Desulfofalx alkaliphila]|uniref:stage II sporulation protein M n=1 Tax=Desulfofalx alkaliphila TaxID=105483 RepID=UPI0004E0E97D|nr:stage II sporulation protein M [Desulfofalx alkaliphila]